MHLLAPQWLAVAALVVPVLWLHMHRTRSERVPSVRLWAAIAVSASRHRTRWPPPLSLPLVLQLLTVLIAALALAEPGFGDRPTHRIFIMDTIAHGDDSQRQAQIDAERQAIERRLSLAPAEAGSRVSVLVAGAVPAIVAARLDDTAALAGPLARVGAQDGAIDARRVADLVHELSGGDEETTALLLTADAADSGGLPGALAPLALRVEKVAGLAAPAEALSLAVRAGDAEGKWLLRGEARLPPADAGYTLRLLFRPDGADTFLDWADQPLNPAATGAAVPVAVDLALPSGGALVAQVLADGRVAASRRYVLDTTAPRVLVLGKATGALVDALKALPHLQLFAADTLPDDDASFDLVIVNGTAVARQPRTNTLWVGDSRLAGSAAPTGFAAAPTRWEAGSELSQGVDWASFTAARAYAFAPLAGADAVAEQGEGSLLEARTLTSGRDVRLAVDVDSSSWPNRADLPVLLHNILVWSGLGTSGATANACVVGQACPLPPRLLAGDIAAVPEQVGVAAGADQPPPVLPASLIHDRQGGWIDAGAEQSFVPQRAGLYRISSGGQTALRAVNPAPVAVAPMTPGTMPADAPPWQPALWRILLGVMALLILVELGVAGWVSERFLRPAGLARDDRRHLRHRAIGVAGGLAAGAVLAGIAGAPLLLAKPVARIVLSSGASGSASGASGSAGDAGQVAIGGAPRIVRDVGGSPVAPSGDAAPGSFADSLQLAQAMAGGRPARLLVDGGVPSAWLGALPQLEAAALPVDVQTAPQPAGDLVVEQVEAPARSYAGDGITLHALVYSPAAVPAKVTVSSDGKAVESRTVQLVAGSNRIELPAGNAVAGNPLYEVSVEADGDPVTDNNRSAVRIAVGPGPRVAVIASQASAAAAFAAALAVQGLQPVVIASDKAPTSLGQWLGYDVVALLDVPAASLSIAQQQQLQSAVRDYGRGLLLLGGESSFGPGGYDQTALEEMSPLSSRIAQDAPKTGLVFAVDRSGSMQLDEGGVSRLTIAKAAVIKAVRLLNPASMVGVVAFDTLALPVVAMQQVDDKVAVESALSLLQPGGGTSLYPGLELAYRMLRDVPYPSRHIIVISDGQSQAGDFAALERQITDTGITVSAIAIGADAEPGVLADIAKAGDGVFHWSRDFHTLPSLLSQETLMATALPVKRGPVQPAQVGTAAEFLGGAKPPAVDGYVATSIKSRAQLDWSVHDDKGQEMPVLAHWQFGSGHVLGLTTQAAGDWVSGWLADAAYPRFWSGVVRAFAPAPGAPDASIDLSRRGDEVVVSAEQPAGAATRDDMSTLVATLTLAGREAPRELTLARQPDGTYQGRFSTDREGDYAVSLPDGTTASIHVAYSAALGAPRPGDDPGGLAAATGGRSLAAGQAPPPLGFYWSAAPDWRVWTCLGLVLLGCSLTLRYLPLRAPFARRSNNREGAGRADGIASTATLPVHERRTAA